MPVSLSKLIKLHKKENLTGDILVRHMEARPFGEAIKPIIALANEGNMHAQNTVCWVYMDGINSEYNPAKGAEYCKKASDQDYAGAQNNLGTYYRTDGQAQDFDKALHYYKLAADERHSAALFAALLLEEAGSPRQIYKRP